MELEPRRTYLTHLTHDVSHRETEAGLPDTYVWPTTAWCCGCRDTGMKLPPSLI